MASHAAISAICCLNWNHKWAIYVMFAGYGHHFAYDILKYNFYENYVI